MPRNFVFGLLALLLFCRSANAGLSLPSSPSTYVPGAPFTIDFHIGTTTNLALFQFELAIKSASDLDTVTVDLLNSTPAGNSYVFPLSFGLNLGNDIGAFDNIGKKTIIVNFNDFIDESMGQLPVSTLPGVNDYVATLRVNTPSTFSGQLEISFIQSTIVFSTDTFGISPIPQLDPNDPNFDPNFVPAGSTLFFPTSAVPVPPSLALVLSGLLTVGAGQLIRRRRLMGSASSEKDFNRRAS